jgi:hypothetical protein
MPEVMTMEKRKQWSKRTDRISWWKVQIITNKKIAKTRTDNWMSDYGRMDDGFRTVCVTSTMETKPCNTKNTEEMPDCYSQCVALTMAWNAAWFTLLTTCHHTDDSNLLICSAVSLGVRLRTFGRILWPIRIIHPASYPRGPESSAACCENLKFCRMLLGWQNTECNIQ